MGKGATQKQAIDEILALPSEDPRRSKALRLLASWKITMEVSGAIDEEDRDLLMTLSPAYLQWQQETERRAMQRGERLVVENLLKVRFGALDERLSAIIPVVLELPAEEYTRLLLQLSREELLSQFQPPTSYSHPARKLCTSSFLFLRVLRVFAVHSVQILPAGRE